MDNIAALERLQMFVRMYHAPTAKRASGLSPEVWQQYGQDAVDAVYKTYFATQHDTRLFRI